MYWVFYDINAKLKEVKWNLHHDEKHGIKDLKFGDIQCDIIYENGEVWIKTNESFSLYINSTKYEVEAGKSKLKL